MNTRGSTLQVSSGVEITTSYNTEPSECFYYCLVRSDCISIEYTLGGTCKLFEKVNSLFSTMSYDFHIRTVRLYLQLFVGEIMAYCGVVFFCIFAYSDVQHFVPPRYN
jgi:hypothetical protein